MCDASSHGVGGVTVGENEACVPTVFRWECAQEVKDQFYEGHISNSNLEMAGLLLLWLVMESVCRNLREKRVTLTPPWLDGSNAWQHVDLWCLHTSSGHLPYG